MPDWLLENENYILQTDRDTFINKSILTLLSVISRIRNQNGYKKERFNINVAFKVAFTFMLIVLLSISGSFTYTIIIITYLLVILSLMQAEEIIKILKLSFVMTAFTFV